MSGVKIYFLFLVTALAISCSSKEEQKPAERPNIIFIMADDHAYQAISAYGEGLNETPNIDRIAKEGAIFTRATVTNSICAPSRAVLLTGKHSFMNGKVDNIQPFNWDQDNFPKLMQANGYATALIGKIHLDGQPQGFDYSIVLPGQGEYYNPDFLINGEKKRIEGYVTDITTDLALDWLENGRDKEKPFVMLYHQKAPHRNWKPAPEYLTLYDDKEFTPPANFFDEETNYQGRGSAAREQEMEIDEIMRWGRDLMLEVNPNGDSTGLAGDLRRFNPEQLKAWRAAFDPKNAAFLKKFGGIAEKDLTLEQKREIAIWKYNRYIKNYLRTIKSVDDGVGEVLDYLEANGLAENTIVVYTSDQGFYLGEHGWFDKRFMYEESFRTPLVMKFPKEIKPGATIKNLVQNLDFAPTFLDYAGLQVPKEMQGESFRKLVSGESKEWRDAVYYTYYEYPAEHSVKRHNGVATDRYKLIHFYYDVDEWELYDLEKDPREMNNVYDNPEYAEVRETMHKKFEEVRTKYGDSDANDKRFLDEYMEVYNKRNSK
ncbi:sulfatase [Algoriphagus aquimarinus]|uniref:sulfatase family protein n=1 Tax=Algoriphagus aquimarinus TaxID=237018 RepID=UPI0030D88AF7|tara:strand:+ start:114955 stop:116583 length:1629 start_codon:yes stop_codon:yes gene_type:complete